jgi:hypothetical protein
MAAVKHRALTPEPGLAPAATDLKLTLAGPNTPAAPSPPHGLQAELETRLKSSRPAKWSTRRTIGVSLAISGALWVALAATGVFVAKAIF